MSDYRFDSVPIKNWEKTPEGYLNFLAPIAREGYLKYYDSAGNERQEYISRKTLRDSAHTFIRKPVTNLHPNEPVTAQNAKKYAVGWTGNAAKMDDRGVLWLQGTVFDADTIRAIESGETKEISCGYKVRTQRRGDRWEQVDRVGNHIAAVPRGRAGSEVAFRFDSSDLALWSHPQQQSTRKQYKSIDRVVLDALEARQKPQQKGDWIMNNLRVPNRGR